jgi:hypothetical protein
MEVFNFEGGAIFGPGSEWLWTLLTAVVLGLSGLAIFRQLSAQRIANELEVARDLDGEWRSERMERYKLAALMDIARGRPDFSIAMARVGDLFDMVAYLSNHGHLQSDLNVDLSTALIQRWWAGMAAPRIARARENDSLMWRDWEALAMRLAERDRKGGVPLDLSPEYLNGPALHKAIAGEIEVLRIHQEMRTGVIPEWPDPEQ